MSDVIQESQPLRHFRMGRRAVLQSLATGAAVLASGGARAAHVHPVAAAASVTAAPEGAHIFLDEHAFDTLSALSDQIVPGARAAKIPEFFDRLLAVESTDTQKRFMQALGAFEREAREANGVPWKSLNADQATALLTKLSTLPAKEPSRLAFDGLKGAVSEAYYATETGMKELGWDGSITFAPPSVCG